jgi:WD40 repeat protein
MAGSYRRAAPEVNDRISWMLEVSLPRIAIHDTEHRSSVNKIPREILARVDEGLKRNSSGTLIGPGTSDDGRAPVSGVEATLASPSSIDETLPAGVQPAAARSTALPVVVPSMYRLGSELARGGMGRILRAEDLRLDRPVAVKELLELSNVDMARRFEREARITARLQHPAIVPVYEAGRWPSGEPFYTMKLVAGRSFAEVIGDTKTTEERLALVPTVIAVAEAIAYAHSHHIIHRDLKPHNVLVGDFGETVVIDWGLAKDLRSASDTGASSIIDAAEGATLAGSVMGTPAFMPPEQAEGKPLDQRADVYAIGAILYNLLTGEAPYLGPNAQVILLAVRDRGVDFDRDWRGVPIDLVAIVRRAMARDPGDRYPSAGELATDLERFQRGQLIASHRYTLGQRVRRFIRRNRTLLAVTGVLLALLAATAIVSVRQIVIDRDRADDMRGVAVKFQGEAEQRAGQLTLQQARGVLASDPTAAAAWLLAFDPSQQGWEEARLIALAARTAGIAASRERLASGVDRVERAWNTGLLLEAADRFWLRTADGTSTELVLGPQSIRPDGDDHRDPLVLTSDAIVFARGPFVSRLRLVGQGKGYRFLRYDLGKAEGAVTQIWGGPEHVTVIDDTGMRTLFTTAGGPGQPRGRLLGGATRLEFAERGSTSATVGPGGVFAAWGIGELARISEAGESFDRVAVSPDGAWIAASQVAPLSTVRLWGSPVTGASKREIIRNARIEDLAFSPDGMRLAIATTREVIEVDTRSGERRAVHVAPSARLRYSPTGVLAYVSRDLVGVIAGSSAARFAHPGVTDVTFVDGRLISAGTAADLRTWRLETQLQPTAGDGLWERDRPPYELSDRGAWLANNVGGLEAVVAFDPATAGGILDRLLGIVPRVPTGRSSIDRGTRDPRFHWDITPDGQTIALVTNRGIEVGPRTGARTVIATGYTSAERVVLAADGSLVAYFDGDRAVLHELPAGKPRPLAEAAFQPRAFSPDHRWLAGATREAIVVVRTDTGARVISDPLPTGGPRQVTVDEIEVSPDNRHAAIALDDGTVRVWQLEPARLARTIEVGVPGSTRVRFLPSGALAVAGANGTVRIVELSTTERSLRGPPSALTSLAVSSDGTRIAAGGARGEVWLWDVASGAGVQLWTHDSAVIRVAFAPGGLVAMSTRGGLRAVRLDHQDPAAIHRELSAVTSVRIDGAVQAWSPGSK